MANLDLYRSRRDFRRTAEPAGRSKGAKRSRAGGAFVIHKHAARRLHYDLRLEHDGALLSWAVTRGPSLDPSDKRLAVHVEDHPLDYASFEGTIPKGQYGGGAVIVWDEGRWTPEGDPGAGLKKGHLRFQLEGRKLGGAWHLVRLRARRGEKKDNWLLIKSDDASARVDGDILEEEPRSVKSGLTVEEVEAGKKPAKRASVASARNRKRVAAQPAAKRGKAKRLSFVEPSLATLQAHPPAGQEWLHEIKFDGYRAQALIEHGEVRLLTRSGLDWTRKFGAQIADALVALPCETAIIDGEIVVVADGGVTSFSALQAALSEGRTEPLVFFAFDLLHLDGRDWRREPLLSRKDKLAELLRGSHADALRYSEHFIEPGDVMLQNACRMGLEGVVSKRIDAPYRSGRQLDWIKSKCTQRQEFVIVGYIPSRKTRRSIRSLLVGYYENDALRPAGRVGTGFSVKVESGLRKQLDRLKSPASAYSGAAGRERGVVWVKPELVAEIEFRAWTADRILRQASFLGLREDKPSKEVVAEMAGSAKAKRSGSRKAKAAASATAMELTNPHKVFWSDVGLTKSGLLAYYETVWPRMQPFVVNRPLSLLRAPDGVGGQTFFQKHASRGMPAAIATMNDPQDGEELLFIRDFTGLAGLVQLGVLEIHLWGATIDRIEQPDQIIFDLDPDAGIAPQRVREATLDVRDQLKKLGFDSLVKTSGGKGFHVVVPLRPAADWTSVKGFAADFAKAMAQANPHLYTATLSKKARAGKIFIDYLRNGRGATAVAPYSARARAGAAVSMPVAWKAVEARVNPDDFRIGDKKLAAALKASDPWADFWRGAKPLKRKA